MSVLYEVDTTQYEATEATSHYVEGIVAPKPHSLAIARLEPDLDGYYLFYRDEMGGNITETCHESLGGAFAQAEFEFIIPRSAWAKVDRREPPPGRVLDP